MTITSQKYKGSRQGKNPLSFRLCAYLMEINKKILNRAPLYLYLIFLKIPNR